MVKHLLSNAGSLQLSAPSQLFKTDPPAFLSKDGKNCFLIVVAIEREVILKTRVNGLNDSQFHL